MNVPGSSSHGEHSIGFVSIYQIAGAGTVGALLVLNDRARPLEFHCTAPIQPNRTQRILYGATLQAYLHGEEIAVALLRRARVPIALALTNDESVLSARHLLDRALCLVDVTASSTESGTQIGNEVSKHRGDSLYPFEIGAFRCFCDASHPDDAAVAKAAWEQTTRFDLAEPFDRLKEAIEESHRCQAA